MRRNVGENVEIHARHGQLALPLVLVDERCLYFVFAVLEMYRWKSAVEEWIDLSRLIPCSSYGAVVKNNIENVQGIDGPLKYYFRIGFSNTDFYVFVQVLQHWNVNAKPPANGSFVLLSSFPANFLKQKTYLLTEIGLHTWLSLNIFRRGSAFTARGRYTLFTLIVHADAKGEWYLSSCTAFPTKHFDNKDGFHWPKWAKSWKRNGLENSYKSDNIHVQVRQ